MIWVAGPWVTAALRTGDRPAALPQCHGPVARSIGPIDGQPTGLGEDPGVEPVETRMGKSSCCPLGKRLFSISVKEGEREQLSVRGFLGAREYHADVNLIH